MRSHGRFPWREHPRWRLCIFDLFLHRWRTDGNECADHRCRHVIADHKNVQLASSRACTDAVAKKEFTGPASSLDAATSGATLGIGLWVAVTIIVLPLVSGTAPQWSATGMRAAFPALIGWIFFGFVFGLALRRAGSGAAV